MRRRVTLRRCGRKPSGAPPALRRAALLRVERSPATMACHAQNHDRAYGLRAAPGSPSEVRSLKRLSFAFDPRQQELALELAGSSTT